ncbi:MAG TPA: hypothetical protein VN372_07970 [Methanospirillum sp.]|nr:hypothetical protein [Methanospirillum sp.]
MSILNRTVFSAIMVAVLVLLMAPGTFAVEPELQSPMIGGDQGWYVFHCHADGAEVSLDNEVKGTITDGELSVPIYNTGTPYQSYTVTYDSGSYHESVTRSLPAIPGKGNTVDIYVNIEPVPTPFPTPIIRPVGGDQGWFDVYCNVEGATVSFDGEVKGVISGHVLSVPVFTTASPYKTVTAVAPDYLPDDEKLTRYPGAGETVDLYLTLNRDPDIPMMGSGSP